MRLCGQQFMGWMRLVGGFRKHKGKGGAFPRVSNPMKRRIRSPGLKHDNSNRRIRPGFINATRAVMCGTRPPLRVVTWSKCNVAIVRRIRQRSVNLLFRGGFGRGYNKSWGVVADFSNHYGAMNSPRISTGVVFTLGRR